MTVYRSQVVPCTVQLLPVHVENLLPLEGACKQLYSSPASQLGGCCVLARRTQCFGSAVPVGKPSLAKMFITIVVALTAVIFRHAAVAAGGAGGRQERKCDQCEEQQY